MYRLYTSFSQRYSHDTCINYYVLKKVNHAGAGSEASILKWSRVGKIELYGHY